MIAEAERQTPETVRREYAETYRELRAAGYTAVGEFHYLGLPEAHAAVEAAREAEIEIVVLLSAYARGGIERFRQSSTAEYFRQLEELRERRRASRLCPPLRPRLPARLARGDRRLCRAGAPAAARPRRRAAARDRRVHRGARHPSDRASRAYGLPGPTNHRRPCDPRRRPRARPAGRGGCARLHLPDDRGEPRRRVRAGRAAARAGNRHLHRLGLERQDRPARGAARARDERPPAGAQPRGLRCRDASLLRRRRRRRGSRPRVVAGRRRRPGAPVATRHRARRRPGRARPRLFRRGLRRELADAHAGRSTR